MERAVVKGTWAMEAQLEGAADCAKRTDFVCGFHRPARLLYPSATVPDV
jgi:hypothetical protein